MPKKSRQPTQKDIFNLIMMQVQKEGWSTLNLLEVARAEGIPLETIYCYFPTKMQALEYAMRQIDHECLAHFQPDESEETPRDRLFSLLMTRFDAMEPYKGMLRSIQADVWMETWNFLGLMPQLLTSMTWMLNAAKFDTNGITGGVRVKIFAVIYLTLMPTWLSDESADLAATMAAVDRALERLAQAPGFYPG